MRNLCLAACIAVLFLLPFPRSISSAQTAGTPQTLFLGDRTCSPNAPDCVFAGVVTPHRYLHVILHDDPGNDNWRVLEGPSCFITMQTLVGDMPIAPDGYLEAVVDLGLLARNGIVGPICFLFKAANAETVTYYAAYFDDTPTPDAATVFPGYQNLGGRPDLPDLDVAYIHRSPSYAYDATPNGPAPRQTIHFTAILDNVGGVPSPPFSYVWEEDGTQVARGSVAAAVAPGGSTELDLPMRWDPRPHQLSLTLSSSGPEISAANDSLAIQTDALSLGLWVEATPLKYFNDRQWAYCRVIACAGSDSFADWLQRQVATWNATLASSRNPALAPAGVADRVRLDEITVVPDGALPLHGGLPTNDPDLADHTVDLAWGLPAKGMNGEYPLTIEGTSDVDWSLLHELGHARSLTDAYRFDITAKPENTIAVHDRAGQLIFDPTHPTDPSNKLQEFEADQGGLFLYQNREQDLMSCPCTPHYSAYNAVVLNRLRGLRARCGNTNPPCNLGEWFTQFPAVNTLKVVGPNGAPVPDGTAVRVFRDTSDTYNTHAFDDADVTLYTTAHGEVQLGSDPFGDAGSTDQAAHKLLLLEVTTVSDDSFCFVEPTQFNLEDWTGYGDAAHPALYTFRLGAATRNDCNLSLPPPRVNEPFATAPYASGMTLGSAGGSRKTHSVLTVTLRDDLRQPMRNRRLEILAGPAGKTLATGMTGPRGTARLRVPVSAHGIVVVDLTDNNRIIPLDSAVARALAGRPRSRPAAATLEMPPDTRAGRQASRRRSSRESLPAFPDAPASAMN